MRPQEQIIQEYATCTCDEIAVCWRCINQWRESNTVD